MALSENLVREFVSETYDETPKSTETNAFGTAVFLEDGEYVRLDGAETLTPATFTTNASEGDRVLVIIRNHRAIVTNNITNPSMTLGELKVNNGLVVKGYLTTNEERKLFDDKTHTGLTFSGGGIGAYGGGDKYWYVTNGGDLFASSAEIVGSITAKSGYLGTKENGFHINDYGIYSGSSDASIATSGYITLANHAFGRTINGTGRSNLRFAIGANFGVSETGVLYSGGADISGKITAEEGYIGTAAAGFRIKSTGIYSDSVDGSGVAVGDIMLANANFKRLINGTSREALRFAIGANFGVSSSGVLYAANVDISGTVTATKGKIGDFTLDGGKLYTGTHSTMQAAGVNGVYIGSDGIGLGPGGKFRVDNAGILNATGAKISGEITATSLTLGSGVTVPYTSVSGTPNLTVYIAKDGTVGTTPADGSNGFVVSSAGVLKASNAIIYGTLYSTAGTIGGFTLGSGKLYSNDHSAWNTNANGAYIGTDYLAYGPNGIFNVTNAGVMTCSSGKIGPWNITSSSLWYGNANYGNSGGMYFGTSGLSVKDKFLVTPAGAVSCFGTLTVKSGNLFVDATSTNGNMAAIVLTHGGSAIGSIMYDANSTPKSLLIQSTTDSLYLSGSLIYIGSNVIVGGSPEISVSGSVHANGFAVTASGRANAVIHEGNIASYLTGKLNTSGGTISGDLTVSGDLTFKVYSGTTGVRPVGSTKEDGHRVSTIRCEDATRFYVHGQWGTTGSTYSYKYVGMTVPSSDIRLKKNVKETEISSALSVIDRIRVRSFDWKDGNLGHQSIGFIADELEKIDSKLADGGGYAEDGSMIIKSVNTFYLQGYLVKGIQELYAEIQDLKDEIKKLKGAA